LGELNDQLLWLDLDARNVGVDEGPIVVNRGRWFDVIANRSNDQRLDLGCGNSVNRSRALSLALEKGGREIIAVLDSPLAGMARGHPVTAVIEDAPPANNASDFILAAL
jgi:hypothetical protein